LRSPTPTRSGQQATADSLREDIADKLSRFNAEPLLDELSQAVVTDCAVRRELDHGRPRTGKRTRRRSAKTLARLEELEHRRGLPKYKNWPLREIAEELVSKPKFGGIK